MNAPHPPIGIKSVLAKLQQARMKLNAMAIKKGARNEFAKYNYMELADFLIPTQEIFTEIGLVGLVSFGAELATLTIYDTDSGESVQITSPMSTAALKGCHEVQNLGAVQTYLRRYLWVAAMEIVEHDAIDSSEPVKPKTAAKVVTPSGAITQTDPAVSSLMANDEQLKFLQDVAATLVQMVEVENKVKEAYDYLLAQKMDNDELVALNNVLQPNSKTRAALKKEGQSRRLGEQA